MYSYFTPAYDGYEGFIDEYGMSVVDTPTKEQAKFIGKDIGAKEYLQNVRESYKKIPLNYPRRKGKDLLVLMKLSGMTQDTVHLMLREYINRWIIMRLQIT